MSHRMVTRTIERLLDDDDLRARFAVDRIEAIARLGLSDITLTPDEIDVFYQPTVESGARAVPRSSTVCTDTVASLPSPSIIRAANAGRRPPAHGPRDKHEDCGEVNRVSSPTH